MQHVVSGTEVGHLNAQQFLFLIMPDMHMRQMRSVRYDRLESDSRPRTAHTTTQDASTIVSVLARAVLKGVARALRKRS